jgi:hypothetical protein
MIIAIISCIIMVTLIDRALRLERIATAQMKARFELFALRDELRRLQRHGDVSADRWFSYMDTTLTRATAAIEAVTLWHAIGYMIASRSTQILAKIDYAERVRKDAMRAVPELASIHARYDKSLAELLRERHALLWTILGLIGLMFRAAAEFRVRTLKAVSGSPETSTLLDYACRA